MYTLIPTLEQKRLFEENFDKKSYLAVRDEINKVLSKTLNAKSLMETLNGYDFEEEEDAEWNAWSFYCERELDRTHMETDADFVSVEFLVAMDNLHKKPFIDSVSLYTTANCVDGRMCWFDPYTCDIVEWYQ